MASPFFDSPTEILRLILGRLSSSDLRNVCLVNRDLRSIAETFLYCKIQWIWEETHTPSVGCFLRSILARPQLATFVQTVILEGDTFERNMYQFRRESPKLQVSETELDKLIKCIKNINLPYSSLWIQELRHGTMDAFVALMLSQLPNLKQLHLGKNFTRENRILGMMLRSTLCGEQELTNVPLPSFEHLRDVSTVSFPLGIDIRRHTDARSTEDILPFFYLPSVKHITASIDNPVSFSWPAPHPPNPRRLESLDLTMIREGHLGNVLCVAKGLRKLRWAWYYRPDLEDRFVTDNIDLGQIAADLSHVRNTLTDLTISAGADMAQADPEFPPLYIKGPFRAFSNLNTLRKLEVPLPLLVGFSPHGVHARRLEESLPRSIEYLTITDNLCFQSEWEWRDVDLLEALRLWLLDWKKPTPRLRGFHLLLKVIDYGEWGPAMRQQLLELGAQVGIQVNITKIAGNM